MDAMAAEQRLQKTKEREPHMLVGAAFMAQGVLVVLRLTHSVRELGSEQCSPAVRLWDSSSSHRQ